MRFAFVFFNPNFYLFQVLAGLLGDASLPDVLELMQLRFDPERDHMEAPLADLLLVSEPFVTATESGE